MEIQHAIIHGIGKQKDRIGMENVQLHPRRTLLTIDEHLIKLGEAVLTLYGRLSNAYGTLGTTSGIHRFHDQFNSYLRNESDFIAFTQSIITLLAESMSREIFATTSYPIILRYSNQGRDWLLIAVLKLKEQVGINQDTLDLNASMAFDINNLREAARIDIEKWQNDEQPYLSFIKRGQGNDAESSRYFRDALSCVEYTDSKRNTDNLIDAANQFSEQQGWRPEEHQRMRQKLYDYFQEKRTNNEPVNLLAVSAIIYDQNPTEFDSYIRDNGLEVSESFSPHAASYKRLRRITSRFGTINVAFDVEDIIQDRVVHDIENDTIIISSPPQTLIDEITKARGG